VASRVDELPAARDQTVVVYCAHGPRAAWAGRSLRKAGFEDIVYLEGHMTEWEEAGRPLESLPAAGAD
jgi:rhodanese-related sulfurtransferase